MSELKCAACQRTLSSLEPLTFEEAQSKQPWTVPYSSGVNSALACGLVPHILASHAVLHATKTVGKLATVFEGLDHTDVRITAEQRETVRAMAADLATAAIRFANLYGFSLADALEERVKEKNGVGIR